MNDVIHDIGGYLPVLIDSGGYILESAVYPSRVVVHRETRQLNTRDACSRSLEEAKFQQALSIGPEEDEIRAILELTSEGSGCSVWVKPDLRSETESRLARFKGCYGAWPVRTLSTVEV